MDRRKFIAHTLQAGTFVAMSATPGFGMKNLNFMQKDLFFKISLAQWSFHNVLRAGKMDNLDFPIKARSLDCEGLEYVNQFFMDKAKDKKYLTEMNNRANSEGVKNVLIMIDQEGQLADTDSKKRLQAIENHRKWIDAAHFLGCHAIRVNLGGGVEKTEANEAAIDSLQKLADFSAGSNINILVENHGGFSSNGTWLANIMKNVERKNCGTLPDFGNFCIKKNKNRECLEEYDKYKGIAQILPFAKGVSAKASEFDSAGNEKNIDYLKMMKLVKESGYEGFIGIEFSTSSASEEEGIKMTRDLLIRAGSQV
ncbi:sugar phosphate isomerase/epimerase family protein [Zobellia barbeyronii]|uniref:Sugar phosphate isomerase/epimerase n=1 Tax=Zobellia barbeyronii TaxID=2748009 RepID=A0ABS5WA20_9FLAO|nr:sugar phosphate isomerase/epimerase family protein [Zobellia barbeyronii]MBT2159670.1 sugar phosphate isomerase/epimerase [Zobellia barbeyronii]